MAKFNQVQNILAVAFSRAIADNLQMVIRLLRSGATTLPTPTPEGAAFLAKVLERNENVTCGALAGTGKTTNIKQVINEYPNATARANTLHGFGLGAWKYYLKCKGIDSNNVKIDEKQNEKIRAIVDAIFTPPVDTIQDDDEKTRALNLIGSIVDLVAMAKLHGYGAFRPFDNDECFYDLMDKFDILIDQEEEKKAFAIARTTLVESGKMLDRIDYTDMIYLPLKYNCRFLWQDLILVDESQDLNPIQQEMIRRVAGNRGQCVFVGDENQSIFGFAGADTKSMETVKNIFRTTVMPLTWCFRCPKVVVKLAQEIVPSIKWAPGAIMGEAWEVTETEGTRYEKISKELSDGDFVICRTTAPLVGLCLNLLAKGIPATVRGKEIAAGLKNLAEKIRVMRGNRGKTVLEAIDRYVSEKVSKIEDESRKSSLEDKCGAIKAIAEDCKNWPEVAKKIESLFTKIEDGNISARQGVILCTAHRAKGLEAANVYIIHPELMPFPFARKEEQVKQEWNLKYVSITRAMKKLTFVGMSKTPVNFRTKITLDDNNEFVYETVKEEAAPVKIEKADAKVKRTPRKKKAG